MATATRTDAAPPAAFLDALEVWPPGYSEGTYAGRRWGATLTVSADARRLWLYAEALGGATRVSFNLYRLAGARVALRPCEMPATTVIAFVLGYQPESR
ncbi:hypothetical protein J2Y58_001779 [Sphingomonas sp. BE138]|uniref:hypothetical protein n=1 Tax=Sphingomonas sp. BE138 TaxID=2817845 RepID=UPI00285CB467|nr:hypothetical protein [Sphingomonas sp. BE138]MDR6788421.1 hypothetical protein [Sphingomonas sp. BE138]